MPNVTRRVNADLLYQHEKYIYCKILCTDSIGFFFSQSDSQNEESTEWKYMALGEREVHNQAIPDTGVKIFFVFNIC